MLDIRRKKRGAFSLIELVIVVVIIGIIAAIAIPKMSRGAAGAADAALAADMQIWRQALDMYQAEHGGSYPDSANIVLQLTSYTNAAGDVSAIKDPPSGYVYGPYMKAIPPLPVGQPSERGKSTIGTSAGIGTAWIYSYDTSTKTYTLLPNADGYDSSGQLYSNY